MPSVAVVVVNYNGAESIEACLRSLRATRGIEPLLIVVDNASTDSSRTILKRIVKSDPAIELVLLDENVGYAGAINRALDTTAADYLAVLNMDLEVDESWLLPLVRVLESRPRVGAVTPLILLAADGTINAAGQSVNATGLGFNRGLGQPRESVGDAPFEVDGIHGAAFVVRASILREIGGVDAEGFLYHEDVNLSWLLRACGYDLYCVPESIVFHDYFLTMYPEKFFLLERNRLAMLLTYLRRSTLLGLAPALALSEALTWGYATLRGAPFLRAKGRAYASVFARRDRIRRRRAWAEAKKTVPDWTLVRKLGLSYDLGQITKLARERGPSTRIPDGGLPTKAR